MASPHSAGARGTSASRTRSGSLLQHAARPSRWSGWWCGRWSGALVWGAGLGCRSGVPVWGAGLGCRSGVLTRCYAADGRAAACPARLEGDAGDAAEPRSNWWPRAQSEGSGMVLSAAVRSTAPRSGAAPSGAVLPGMVLAKAARAAATPARPVRRVASSRRQPLSARRLGAGGLRRPVTAERWGTCVPPRPESPDGGRALPGELCLAADRCGARGHAPMDGSVAVCPSGSCGCCITLIGSRRGVTLT